MPMRLRDFARFLKEHGVRIEHASRHYVARRGEGRAYAIPAHKGMDTELPDVYLKGCCKHFGIDPNAWKKR